MICAVIWRLLWKSGVRSFFSASRKIKIWWQYDQSFGIQLLLSRCADDGVESFGKILDSVPPFLLQLFLTEIDNSKQILPLWPTHPLFFSVGWLVLSNDGGDTFVGEGNEVSMLPQTNALFKFTVIQTLIWETKKWFSCLPLLLARVSLYGRSVPTWCCSLIGPHSGNLQAQS